MGNIFQRQVQKNSNFDYSQLEKLVKVYNIPFDKSRFVLFNKQKNNTKYKRKSEKALFSTVKREAQANFARLYNHRQQRSLSIQSQLNYSDHSIKNNAAQYQIQLDVIENPFVSQIDRIVFENLPIKTWFDRSSIRINNKVKLKSKNNQIKFYEFQRYNIREYTGNRGEFDEQKNYYFFHSNQAKNNHVTFFYILINYAIVINDYIKIYAMFTGQGMYKSQLSYFSCKVIIDCLLKDVNLGNNPLQALKRSVKYCNELLKEYKYKQKRNMFQFNSILSGSGFAAIIQFKRRVYVINLGDLHTFYVTSNSSNQIFQRHIPSNPSQKLRIYKNGGQIRLEGASQKVFMLCKPFPGLKVTRSVGDQIGKLIGVNSQPQIVELKNKDFIILICTNQTLQSIDQLQSLLLEKLNFRNSGQINKKTKILQLAHLLQQQKISFTNYSFLIINFSRK